MLKYKVITKEILAEGMDKEDAVNCMMIFRDLHPENIYYIEEYDWSHVGHRLGRDPDLN